MTRSKQKEDWEELIRSGFCQYNVCVPLHSIKYSNSFVKGPKYNKLLIYIKKDIAFYYENFADHYKVGKYCLNLFLKNKSFFSKYLKFWHSEFDKLNLLFKKIRKTNLKSLSDTELVALLEKVYTKSIKWHGIAYNVDAIDTVLNPLVEKIIKDNYPNRKKSDLSQIYNKLTFPKVLSYVTRMNLEKLELAIEVKKIGLKNAESKINKFIDSYYWTKFGWKGEIEYNKKELLNEIKKISANKAKKELLNEIKKFKDSLNQKEFLLKEISKNYLIIKDYINIFDEYAILHDLRKEGQMKSVNSITKIYLELAKRLKVKNDLLFHYWPIELVKVVKKNKKVDLKLLKKRKEQWFCEYYCSGKCVEYFGKNALKMRDKALGLNITSQQKELSGIGASQGRIIGTAKVCLSSQIAAKKIREGDILVTGMTMPEFVPSMKKAAAIVTDEGGITCHAAIIARELGKPCVVGTKMATRMIKDGNKLEVNANHGVVKILK